MRFVFENELWLAERGRFVWGAGKLGDISLDPQGPICRRGDRGCLEVYARIPAVLAQARSVHPDFTLAKLMELCGADAHALTRIVAVVAGHVAKLLSLLCNEFDPELVLIRCSLCRRR